MHSLSRKTPSTAWASNRFSAYVEQKGSFGSLFLCLQGDGTDGSGWAGSAKIQCQKGVRRPALSAVSSRLLPCRWCKPCERVAIKNGACSACLYCIWDAMSIEMQQQQAQSAHIFECPEGMCFLFCVSPGARGLAGWHFASGRQRRLNNCCASQWMIYRCIWIRFPMCWRARSCAQHSTRSATTHGLRIPGR